MPWWRQYTSTRGTVRSIIFARWHPHVPQFNPWLLGPRQRLLLKRRLDRFDRFCRIHQHADTHTDSQNLLACWRCFDIITKTAAIKVSKCKITLVMRWTLCPRMVKLKKGAPICHHSALSNATCSVVERLLDCSSVIMALVSCSEWTVCLLHSFVVLSLFSCIVATAYGEYNASRV